MARRLTWAERKAGMGRDAKYSDALSPRECQILSGRRTRGLIRAANLRRILLAADLLQCEALPVTRANVIRVSGIKYGTVRNRWPDVLAHLNRD